jgi:subfamily B ATP-binding cassette protein MsbA
VIAIVGPTGSGKTTLINLILRFYDPQKGVIKIDGKDFQNLKVKSLRNLMGIVTQETVLFNDTVRANIAYGHLEANDNAIMEAASKAFAHNFIKDMPKGYDTVIGDRGFKLSGGEKQRLTIARAILKNPPILILDEATSALDAQSERYVQEALDYLMQNRTVFVIAHRLSTVRKASRILVVNQGEIIESGTHEQLLQKGGLYSHLHSLQFK